MLDQATVLALTRSFLLCQDIQMNNLKPRRMLNLQMKSLPRLLTLKRSWPQYVAACLVSLLIVTAVSTRYILHRAPWMDEFMLYLNYPLQSPFNILKPLDLYDQAAPPMYSAFFGWTAILNTSFIRTIHLLLLFFISLLTLGSDRRSFLSVFIATIALTALPYPFKFFLEMKHYGLEAIGSIGIILWFIRKPLSGTLNYWDIIILSLCSLLGVSTCVVSTISLLLYLVFKIMLSNKLKADECWLVFSFYLILTFYYGILKSITRFQLSNYPEAYANEGAFQNLRWFGSSLLELLGAPGQSTLGFMVVFMLSTTLIALMLFASPDNKAPFKLASILVVVVTSFAVLSMLNLYPSKYARHAIWASSFAWLIAYYGSCKGLESIISKFYYKSTDINTQLLGKPAFLQKNIMLESLVFAAILVFFLSSSLLVCIRMILATPSSDALDAIAYIRKQPATTVMLNNGAQVAYSYYSRFSPDLAERELVGSLSAASTYALPPDSLQLDKLAINKTESGSWSRSIQPNADRDSLFAENLSSLSGKSTFLIFSYWPGTLSKVQKFALSYQGCAISDMKEFGVASVYDVRCKGQS